MVMQEPEEIPEKEHERIVARVAAIDVAKASGKVCTRTPHPQDGVRRVTKVWGGYRHAGRGGRTG